MATVSPYEDAAKSGWLETTRRLVAEHPLRPEEILEIAQVSWNGVWATSIGSGAARIGLREINPPATVVGYFFEKLFAKELARRYPDAWRGESSGKEKDLHYLPNQRYSVEMKASGQPGLRVYGNRSYGQTIENEALAKKDKSGYYITVNFHGDRLNLIRFGWIDSTDWKPQRSAAGQMAGLDEDVYALKLLPIRGEYALQAPICLLAGVGPRIEELLKSYGISSISDVLSYKGSMDKQMSRVRAAAERYKAEYF